MTSGLGGGSSCTVSFSLFSKALPFSKCLFIEFVAISVGFVDFSTRTLRHGVRVEVLSNPPCNGNEITLVAYFPVLFKSDLGRGQMRRFKAVFFSDSESTATVGIGLIGEHFRLSPW